MQHRHPSHALAGLRAEVDASGQGRLLVARAHRAGEVVLRLEGDVQTEPTRHSVQIGPDAHVLPDDGALTVRSVWRYMNHSCAPTVAIRDGSAVALRDLEPFDEVTFDYCTTEIELSNPFACHCGADACRVWISGYRHLTDEERTRLECLVAPHLAEHPVRVGDPSNASPARKQPDEP